VRRSKCMHQSISCLYLWACSLNHFFCSFLGG
jgi:hypothetical protein